MHLHLLSEFLVLDNNNNNNNNNNNIEDNLSDNYVLNNEIDVHISEGLETVSDNDLETDSETDLDSELKLYNDINNYENSKQKCNLFYNEQLEIQNEIDDFNYHLYKNSYNWLLAKKIVSLTVETKTNTEFFWDYLDILFHSNSNNTNNTNNIDGDNDNNNDNDKNSNINHNHIDNFDDIQKVIFSFDNNVFEFNNIIAKYLVDNLKIFKYKPSGYIFNKNNNEQNKFNFKIVVITNANVYSVNRYIDENKLGFY